MLAPRGLAAVVIAAGAGRLQKPGGREAQRQSARGNRPRLTTTEVLRVGQQLVGILVAQISPDVLGVAGKAFRGLGWSFLTLLAQRLANRAQIVGLLRDLRCGLRRALVQLLAQLLLRLSGRLLGLVLRLVGGLASAVLRAIGAACVNSAV